MDMNIFVSVLIGVALAAVVGYKFKHRCPSCGSFSTKLNRHYISHSGGNMFDAEIDTWKCRKCGCVN